MHSAKFISAIVAFGAAGLVAGQTCTKDIEITMPTQVIDCEVVDADITVGEDVAGDVVINGPEQIKGNLIVSNASAILSISSTTINSIGGRFELTELNALNAIRMQSLRSVNELVMIKLNQLRDLTFGAEGVSKAESVTITDTFLDDLSGLMLATVDKVQINSNRRLTKFNSDLVNITTSFIITSNGNNMDITMNNLETAAEIQIANVKSFTAPLLATISASLKFDQNPELESFAAPNLTKVTDAVSFINNKKLANISLPLLTEISGDLTIVNNTELTAIDGLPLLETVSGGIVLGGNFEKVELPELNDVKGSVEVSSTTDISDFCDFFDSAKDADKIQGKNTCTSDNANANEGGDGGSTNDENGGSNDNSDDSAAGFVSVNAALLGLAFVAGAVQLL